MLQLCRQEFDLSWTYADNIWLESNVCQKDIMKSKRKAWAQTNKTINVSLSPKGYVKNKQSSATSSKEVAINLIPSFYIYAHICCNCGETNISKIFNKSVT